MKKGDKIICVSHTYSDFDDMLTVGKVYTVTAGVGDMSMFGTKIDHGWQSEHDCGLVFYQSGLSGVHGEFEIVE